MGQILLACYLPSFGCEFFEECSSPSDAVEVKEPLRACVAISEPGGGAELVVPRHLLLKGIDQVALRPREDVPYGFVLGVPLKLNLR